MTRAMGIMGFDKSRSVADSGTDSLGRVVVEDEVDGEDEKIVKGKKRKISHLGERVGEVAKRCQVQ